MDPDSQSLDRPRDTREHHQDVINYRNRRQYSTDSETATDNTHRNTNTDIGSLLSDRESKFSTFGYGQSYPYSQHYTYKPTETLELFPDPDAPEKIVRHKNCCCTCKCREDKAEPVYNQPAPDVRSVQSPESDKNKDKFTIIYDQWVEWSGDTSMHGIKYIFHGSKISKILFLIFMLVFVGKLGWQLMESVKSYNSFPTGSKIQIADPEGPPTVTFPTISLCSHNHVTQSYLDKNPGLDELWQVIDSWDEKRAREIDFAESRWSKYSNYTYTQVLLDGGPDINNVMQCEHFVNECYENEVFGDSWLVRDLTLAGNCYRINPEGLLKGKGGDYGKLSLKLFADLNEYSTTNKEQPQVGFAVQFHDHEQYSSAMPTSFWMSPGLIYKADLSLLREKRLPPPAGRCNDTIEYNSYGRHEENSCLAECRDDDLIAKCGCVLVPPPMPQNNPSVEYKNCTLQQWATCGISAWRDFYNRYVNSTRTDKMCHCYPACKETFFKASLSSSILSGFYAQNHVAKLPAGYGTVEDVTSNLVVIDVYFANTQETEIIEIISYGWGNFLGDVGGVLGLFLGASAFTLIEFAIFIVTCVWTFISSFWRPIEK